MTRAITKAYKDMTDGELIQVGEKSYGRVEPYAAELQKRFKALKLEFSVYKRMAKLSDS